jgi:hypothetical protein
MSTKKVMRLIDGRTGQMECRVCGSQHFANLRRGGGYHYGSWQCIYRCKLPLASSAAVQAVR